jgi:hypothetical protein
MTERQRGYGWPHQKVRRRVARLVDASTAICARCGRPIAAGQLWDLGHNDVDRSLYSGPEHRLAKDCPKGGNRATNRRGRVTAVKPNAQRFSRVW